MAETALIVAGFVLLVLGIVGCVLPVIPGPPLAYLSLILMSIARRWRAFSPAVLIVLAVLTVAVSVLDALLPVFASKRRGASKAGVWGSVIGLKLAVCGAIAFYFVRAFFRSSGL